MRRLWVIALLLVMLAAGVVQAQDGESELPPAPGELIDVGGYSLHLNCTGEGGPAVILDAGLGDWSINMAALQDQVAEFAQVCTYDRAGYGWSDEGREPRTSQQIVDELAALLENSTVEPPYILAGHSFGGVNMLMFAAQHPDQVAGVVLLDSSHPEQMDTLRAEVPEIVALEEGASAAYQGMLDAVEAGEPVPPEMLDAFRPQGMGDEDFAIWSQMVVQPKHLRAMIGEMESLDDSLAQAQEIEDLGDIPLVVVAHGVELADMMTDDDLAAMGVTREIMGTYEALWRGFQEDYLTYSTDSTLIIAEESHHYVYVSEPDLVVEAIRELVGAEEVVE